jgi:hypothetical protein
MKLTIQTILGPRELTAQLAVPGLAVHKGFERKDWRVTHIASGCSLLNGYRSREAAMRDAKKIRNVTDWTQSAESLKAMVGLGAKVRKILRRQKLNRIPTFLGYQRPSAGDAT